MIINKSIAIQYLVCKNLTIGIEQSPDYNSSSFTNYLLSFAGTSSQENNGVNNRGLGIFVLKNNVSLTSVELPRRNCIFAISLHLNSKNGKPNN